MDLENELSGEEIEKADRFYERLKQPDLENVKKVLEAIDWAANFFSNANTRFMGFKYGSKGRAFFLSYLIGGNLTKKGERPNIDLLVATNFLFEPVEVPDEDIFVGSLNGEFENYAKMEIEGELPDNYNMGRADGKCLIRLIPKKGKSIDINYVRDDSPYEEEFLKKDIGKNGEQLSRLILYRNLNKLQQMRMHW